jgi:ribosomal protein S27E
MSGTIELMMIENGFDFILKSFDDIENDDLKYTALHLYSGILLILKERLYQEEKKLIFEKIDRYNENSLKSGNFQSVKYDTLLKRLEEIDAGISRDFEKELEWLKNARNKMEHFQVNIRVDALKSHIVNILVHLVPFIKSELVYNDFLDEEDEKLQSIVGYLNQYQKYVKAKLISIDKQPEVKKRIIDGLECPHCGNDTIIIDGDSEVYCHFCEKKFVDFEDEYINANYNLYRLIKDGGTDPRFECVDCESNSMVYVELADAYICLSCGCSYKEKEISFCARCENQIVINKYPGEPAFCDYCLDEFRSR